MKKILTILIVTLLILAVAAFGWYFFFRDPSVPVAETIKDILPFGSEREDTTPTGLPGGERRAVNERQPGLDEFNRPTANLFRIAATPVAGLVVFDRANQTVVRYVDRATGHIYDITLPVGASSTALEKIRVTNNTLPKIYEAYFRPDGNAVLLRTLKDDSETVENLSLALTPPQTDNELYNVSSTVLRGDMSAVAVGAGNTLLYALRDASAIVSSTFTGSGARTLLTLPFTDWRLAASGSSLIAYTKASASAPGYAYTLNISSGALRKILGPLNGLVAIPDTTGNRVLYSYIEGDTTKLFSRNLTNNAVVEITPATLAEKCVWSVRKTGNIFCGIPTEDLGPGEPDHWYRGMTHFSDRLWLMDANAGLAKILAEPATILGLSLDAIELKLAPSENYLIFINKADLSLWALRLEQS